MRGENRYTVKIGNISEPHCGPGLARDDTTKMNSASLLAKSVGRDITTRCAVQRDHTALMIIDSRRVVLGGSQGVDCTILTVLASCPLAKENVFSTSRIVLASRALLSPDDVKGSLRAGAFLLTKGASSCDTFFVDRESE